MVIGPEGEGVNVPCTEKYAKASLRNDGVLLAVTVGRGVLVAVLVWVLVGVLVGGGVFVAVGAQPAMTVIVPVIPVCMLQ